jgi:hypothetical protein
MTSTRRSPSRGWSGEAELAGALAHSPGSATETVWADGSPVPCASTLSSPCGAVAHALLLAAWIRSLRATRLAHPLRTTDGRLRRSSADARPEPRGRALGREFSSAPERAEPHGTLPAMRATTHVDGNAIRSSRRARRGAGCWLRRTIGASGRTPMSSSRMTWRRASAARRPLIGSACPDGRRGGGGVRSATLRTITRRSTAAAGVRPRSRSSARARAARSRVVRSGRRRGPVETPAYQRSSCAAARGAFQPLLRFVLSGDEIIGRGGYRSRRKSRRRSPGFRAKEGSR